MAISTRHIVRAAVAVVAIALCCLGACSEEQTLVDTGRDDGTDSIDASPPSRVTDLALEGHADAATLTWTAPHDDYGVVAYEIRYSYSFPLHWELARRVDDPPEPETPGTPQSYTFVAPERGRDLFAAIRSLDASGNISPTSAVATARIDGYSLDVTCLNAFTGDPVEGLEVTVTSHHVHDLATDANGATSLRDLVEGSINVSIHPGTSGVPFHYIDHGFELRDDASVTYQMIPFRPTDGPAFDSVLQLFLAAAGYSSNRPILKKWHSVPVPVYTPELVNVNGIDYGDACRRAAAQWEMRSGVDLWEFVASPEDAKVVFYYKSRSFMTPHIGYTVHFQDDRDYPREDHVYVVDDLTSVTGTFITMMHELGHTIRFSHLPSGYLMYAGQPLPDDVTDDEALAVQLYSAMPNGINLGVYDYSMPDEAK